MLASSPQSKAVTPLGELAEVKLGKMLDKKKGLGGRMLPYLRNINVRWGRVDTSDLLEMAFEDDELDRFGLRAGDVLVCEGGEPGRAAVWNDEIPNLKFQKAIHRVRFKVPFEPKLLVYYLELLAKTGGLERRFTGSTIKHFTREAFLQLPVPVKPLSAQRQIVADIEKQFTRLDAGVAALRRVQANLKRYRAAVLKAACEGRLVPTEADLACKEGRPFETGEQLLQRILVERRQTWNKRNKYIEPMASTVPAPSFLPKGWASATTEQLTLSNRPSAYGVLQPGADIPTGVPLVRVGDINNGKIDLSNLKRISSAIDAQFPRTKLQGGELAITLVGAIGRTAVIPKSLAGGNTARAVGIVPLSAKMNPHWVEIWFRNPAKILEMTSKSHEVARKTLNLEDVRSATVAVPPLAEQKRIVTEVERRLSVIDELETVVTANLTRATRLRQSILQRNFTPHLNE